MRLVTDPHILVVDDDDLIQDLLETMLSRAGYRVSVAADGPGLRSVLQREPVDLVLLDVKLGADHGFDLAREITDRYNTPIIFVTGDRDVSDKVTGLEIGAEDYVTKPFDQRELLARIRVVLRRHEDTRLEEDRRLLFEGFVLHLDAHELHAPSGDIVDLTTMELQILAFLAQKPRQALSRNDISLAVSGKTREARDRTIDVVVSKLRRKLEEANPRSEVAPIQTVRGVGYKFVSEVRQV
jgi:two-component system OmpR family response regulator